MGVRLRAWGSAGLAITGAVLALAAPALGAFPGQNGKIAFSATNDNVNEYPTTDLYSVNPDGSGLFQIIDEDEGTWEDSNFDEHPEWSPDGTRLAFTSLWIEGGNPFPEVETINADGTGRAGSFQQDTHYPSWAPDGSQVLFTAHDDGDHGDPTTTSAWIARSSPSGANITFLRGVGWSSRPAAWSPDGTRIAFGSNGYCYPCKPDLYTASAVDGSGPVQLTSTPDFESDPDWSPDGSRIVFTSDAGGDWEIYVMNADGTGTQQLTINTVHETSPSWSPDGTKIAFVSNRSPAGIYVMNADGSNPTFVIEGDQPDWQPIPVNGYPRPKGTYPLELSLVPAYRPCTAPNRVHGPPLAFPSCAPPQREPGELTIGTADSNQRPTKSVSIIRMRQLVGNPQTPADEADIALSGTVNDVRLASDLSDYTGTLEARMSVRITDKDNTPHPGGPGAATVQDITYSFPIPCAATPDTTIGADCTFDTTAEAFVPGIAKELRRSIWELGAIRVHDGAGNLFMTQGVFVP